jgi:hypothetical protein
MWRIVTLGTGVGGAGLWAIFSQAGNTAYTRYLTTSVTQEALKLRRAFRTWDGLSYAAATLGVAGLGVHLWLSLRDTPGNEAETRLIGVEGEIQALETQLQ